MKQHGKAKAAGFAGMGGLSMGSGEAWPHNYSSTDLAEKQAAIFERLQADYQRARKMAVYHLRFADRFMSEAESIGALLRESERLQ